MYITAALTGRPRARGWICGAQGRQGAIGFGENDWECTWNKISHDCVPPTGPSCNQAGPGTIQNAMHRWERAQEPHLLWVHVVSFHPSHSTARPLPGRSRVSTSRLTVVAESQQHVQCTQQSKWQHFAMQRCILSRRPLSPSWSWWKLSTEPRLASASIRGRRA